MAMASTWEIFPANLDATAAFYAGVLDFSIITDDREGTDPYLALRRDNVVIGASRRTPPRDLSARRPPVGVELGIEVDDLDDTYSKLREAEWPIEVEIIDRPWGVRDFRVLDPDGYYLCIREHEYF